MDFLPDELAGGGEPPPVLKQPKHEQQRRWLVEVWSYTAFLAVALSAVALLLTGDLLLMIPVIFVCLLAGVVGTILAIQRSQLVLNEHTEFESIFR